MAAAASQGAGDEPPRGGAGELPPREDAELDGDDSEAEDAENGEGDAKVPKELFTMKIGPSKISAKIDKLKKDRERIKAEHKEASKHLKREKRQQNRLRAKANKLDNNDLMEVFRLRADIAAKAKAKAKAKAAQQEGPGRNP